MSNFKPNFDGYMKIYLHDDIPERLADRAEFTGKWLAATRKKIINKPRRFQVTLHIMDKDGNKRGLQTMVFKNKGGHSELSKVIFGFGNDFVDELRAQFADMQVDLINSYAVVRA
ncbi:hypothetical protein [Psychrobacter pygoscelis]|uniref:hypothetical protein n=1 Tax=Psychrobacter pygoscelis TaxID=2488563 RepID=UPI00103EEE9B|nr:hypothetical protein [Psychrobacter pygoscelis]